MNTDQLRIDLDHLADQAAAPSPRLADDVLARRRTQRNRRLTTVGTGLAVVLVVALVPVVGSLRDVPGGQAAEAVGGASAAGTRGSLAEDPAFLAALRELPWTYQQWRSPDGTGFTIDPQPQPAEDWTSVTVDLAAAYRPDQREVLFAGDVPGGRWALVALRAAGGDTVAWFTGPAGAGADEMSISGTPQTRVGDEPLAHVDLRDPQRSLVVVTAPGDQVQVSDRAVLDADGTVRRSFEPVADEDRDGVVVTALESSTRFGVPASVRVLRGGEDIWRTAPSVAGPAAGIDPDDARGWPVGIQSRFAGTVDPGHDYLDQALTTALGPFGTELTDLADGGAPELVQVFQGPDAGSPATGSAPLITVYSIRMPSGARLLVGGHTRTPGEPAPAGRTPDQAVSYLDVRPADDPVEGDVVAIDMEVGIRTLVISGPRGATEAVVLDADGAQQVRVPLEEGVTSLPFPAGASAVQVVDRNGRLTPAEPISSGQIGSWGDFGSSSTTSFATPIPPPA
ncbi:hypothetical protein [Modestobacter sp. SYSU DS0290]